MSKNYYKISKLKGYYRMKYLKTTEQIQYGSATNIYPDANILRMRELSKRESKTREHPSFAHADDKSKYIQEVQERLQYKNGVGTFDIKNNWGRSYYNFNKYQSNPKIDFMDYFPYKHNNALRPPEQMAWNYQDYIKSALEIRREKLKAKGYTGEEDK